MQIMKRLIGLFVIVIGVACLGIAQADVVSAKGKATVTYTEKQATPDTKAKALLAAQMKAIEFYFAEAGDAQSENLDAIRSKIKEDPDRYILESTVLAEEEKTDVRQYTVTVRVSLNGSNLRNAMKAGAAVSTVAAGDRSQLAFVFVSRQVASQTTYDDRVFKRVDTTADSRAAVSASQKGTEGEVVRKNQVSTNASVEKQATASAQGTATAETGGSVTKKAAVSSWQLIPSQDLSSAVTQIFKTAGYRVVEAQFVEPMSGGKLKVAAIEADYKSGNDLQSATLQNVVLGMRTAQVRYVALGTLDAGPAAVDSATGLQRVAVTVNAKVIDVGQGIPESVAVAGPAQYSAVGPNADEARTSALKLAAQSAARELTSQLANAGLR